MTKTTTNCTAASIGSNAIAAICTTAKTNEEGYALLEEMGMPFRKQ